MPTIPGCNISFDKVAARRASPSSSRALVSDGRVRSRIDAAARTQVAREIRCKYAADASGGPADSASLKAAELVLQEFLPTLKALPNAEVTRIMCGGCHDFARGPRPSLIFAPARIARPVGESRRRRGLPRGYSAETSRGAAAGAAWIYPAETSRGAGAARTFRGDESKRRRGCRADSPRRRVAAPPRVRPVDIPRRRVAASPAVETWKKETSRGGHDGHSVETRSRPAHAAGTRSTSRTRTTCT